MITLNPLINLGFFEVHWYSLLLCIAILFGSFLAIKEAKKHDIDEDVMTNLLFYAIICGIIGARIYYVIFNLDYYSMHVMEIFAVWQGGLAIHGGIIGALIFIYWYCRKYKINIIKILDFIVVGLIIAQAIGRWGNFFNGEAHGPQTTLSFLKNLYLPDFIIKGMFINGNYYIPTFFYESLWCFIGFIILLILRKQNFTKFGYLTSFYLVWYGICRFFIESFRTDSLMLFSFKIAQIVSLFMVVSGICLFVYSKKNEKYKKVK